MRFENALLGEIQKFSFKWAPQGWQTCEGQLLDVNTYGYAGLFELLKYRYGGDGKTRFALPDLREAGQRDGVLYCICLQGVYPSRGDSYSQTEPLIGQIQGFPYDFVPSGWMSCEGQVLPLAQNEALGSVVGFRYGGDQKTTFALPDLRERSERDKITYCIAVTGIYPSRH